MNKKYKGSFKGKNYESLEEMEKEMIKFYDSMATEKTVEHMGRMFIKDVKENFKNQNIRITNSELEFIFHQTLNDIMRLAQQCQLSRMRESFE